MQPTRPHEVPAESSQRASAARAPYETEITVERVAAGKAVKQAKIDAIVKAGDPRLQ